MVANRDNPIIREEQFNLLVKEIKKTMAMKSNGWAFQSLWGDEPLLEDELKRLDEIFPEFYIELHEGSFGSFLRIARKITEE